MKFRRRAIFFIYFHRIIYAGYLSRSQTRGSADGDQPNTPGPRALLQLQTSAFK